MLEAVGDSTRDGRWALVRLAVEGDRIVSAETEGLERPLAGLTLLEAAAVGGEELAVDALSNALAQVFRAEPKAGRVAVAMSGGVDSAVALLRAGENAIGVTLRLWLDPHGPDAERACCSPEAVIAARTTCHRLGIPHVTLDLREAFRRAVVEPFVRGYAAGETPNPCIRCNGSFRFAELLAFAERAGAERLATGHYARIVDREGRLLLARAADERKDQSYMLGRLDPRFLDRLWFPLGNQSKDETRAEAASAGLEAARRAESQEACFLAGGDYRDFLARHGLAPDEGPVLDEQGNELGRHAGFWRFTPGQRKGLGVAAGEPLYALRSEPGSNAVVVGPRAALATTEVAARGRLHVELERVEAKLRYRSPAVGASVTRIDGGFRLRLDRPAYGVAPGQAAVLYDEGAVVGAGTILGDPAETPTPVSAFESEGA
ncbi:MAG TPA: tRNA 2-thiouridine(34) synthase MnmA [Gaiellaceae bacterium]|nr:tRNA 2-thiouridine(34) synthase MnmA [Gaiellaceae bacterium]